MRERDRRTFLKTATAATGWALMSGLWRPGRAERRDADTGVSFSVPIEFLGAIEAGDERAVRDWLTRDPSLVRARDDAGRSPFALALLAGHPAIAAVFREAGHEPDLHESALALDWDRLSELAEREPDRVDADHAIGGTAMFAAARGGAGNQIFHVYAVGGHPNAVPRGRHGMTPLRAAFECPDLTAAEMTAASLLANGADPNGPTPGDDSPLHAAARRNSRDLVEYLIRKGARTDARNADGDTPLDVAERTGGSGAAELLRAPATLPRVHSTSRSAFDAAGRPYRAPDLSAFSLSERGHVVGVAHRDFDAVREAVERNPLLAHARATTTEAAVEASAHMGRTEMVSYFLDRGAPYSLPTAVVRNDMIRARALLVEDPFRIHERGAHDFPLLWYPVIGGELLDMAELLLTSGVTVDGSHWMGTTALHYAALGGQADMVAFLIDHGADVNRLGRKFDPAGQTALQLAAARGNESIVRLLEQRGAER